MRDFGADTRGRTCKRNLHTVFIVYIFGQYSDQATGWMTMENSSIASRSKLYFLPTKCPDPPSLLLNDYRGTYPGNKVEHPLLTSTKDKNMRSCI